jgi:glutamate dehydrogenase
MHPTSPEDLKKAVLKESKNFEMFYLWLEKHMPPAFFEEIGKESFMLLTHNLMSFHLQDFFSQVHLKDSAIVLCLDSPDADLRILREYDMFGIRYYRAFVSNEPPPFPGVKDKLRVALILFTEGGSTEKPIAEERKNEILKLFKERLPEIPREKVEKILSSVSPRFLRSTTNDRLMMALEMCLRAKSKGPCQYMVRYNEDWKEKESPSMQLVLAWRNVPKYRFLRRLTDTIHRHHLSLQKVVASYVDAYSTESVLILSLGLHGQKGGAAWEEADIDDFLQELVTLKYFTQTDVIKSTFVDSGLIRSNMANFVETMISFVHQVLVHADPHFYSHQNIEEGFCRHPELTAQLTEAFELKFKPKNHDKERYEKLKAGFLVLVENLDTGHAVNDLRRKNVLRQGLNFIEHILKTNFYTLNKTSFSFRLDPHYLENVPYDRKEKFPSLPYGIFFVANSFFLSFHIRFKDLARGGLRTVIPERMEQYVVERNNVFAECYNLAYTQHKKNKDIPEGGAKAVILLKPFEQMSHEWQIYQKEMENAQISHSVIEERVNEFKKSHKWEYLYRAQKSFIESFLTLINCEDNGILKAENITDYYKRPEYIYLGPDENMFNTIIEWIAKESEMQGYKPGSSFITSKPNLGINHKEFGVTSLGVNVYVKEILSFLGIDSSKDPFTVKISGGPDGDVAGNMILNLLKYYPKTAKLIALTDVSGTIYDPQGLDLHEMAKLFKNAEPIKAYPPEKLSEGGFLLDIQTKREQTAYMQQTLCWRKKEGKLVQDWLTGNEMNHLYRSNVHKTKTDIFIPCGGRPRTLNETNYQDFLDDAGRPTSKAIVEGANLYLTAGARKSLEKLGVLIVKDSSANKGGVICSSFEVLSTLALTKEEFLKEKTALVAQIQEIIGKAALNEAKLLLSTYQKEKGFLTDISDRISETINTFKYQLLDYFETLDLSKKSQAPLIECLLLYAPALLREKYAARLLERVPPIHQKAVIACYIASHLVYSRGLDWSPKIADILPLIVQDPAITKKITD